MEVRYERAAVKVLSRMPAVLKTRIVEAIGAAARGDPNSDIKRLQGRSDHRIRVGDWRVIVDMDGDTLTVVLVAPRGAAYRKN